MWCSFSLYHSITQFLLLIFLLVVPLVHAETKNIVAESTYLMGDGETPGFAETMVLQKAKQTALEQAGTYVESYTKVLNLDLTVEEIQTLAGGIIETNVLEKSRTLVGEGLSFYVKIRATITTDHVHDLARRIKGGQAADEYKKLQEQYARLEQELQAWKELERKASAGQEKAQAIQQIQEREKAFSKVQQNEVALFKRLVSGEALIHYAEDERMELDRLFVTLRDNGHTVELGEPKTALVPGNAKEVLVLVPVKLSVSPNVFLVVSQVSQRLKGRIINEPLGPQAYGIRLAQEWETQDYLLAKLRAMALAIHLTLLDQQTFSCVISNQETGRQSRSPLHRLYPARFLVGVDYAYKHNAEESFLLVDKRPAIFTVKMLLAKSEAAVVKEVQAEFITSESDPELMKFPCGIG